MTDAAWDVVSVVVVSGTVLDAAGIAFCFEATAFVALTFEVLGVLLVMFGLGLRPGEVFVDISTG